MPENTSGLPEKYKTSLIKTLVYRAYNICSTWELFEVEIRRIRKNLCNNGFPLTIIDKIINNQICKLCSEAQATNKNSDDITYYARCFEVDSFKGDQTFLRQLFNNM